MILRDGLSIMAWVHMAWTQCINSEPEPGNHLGLDEIVTISHMFGLFTPNHRVLNFVT